MKLLLVLLTCLSFSMAEARAPIALPALKIAEEVASDLILAKLSARPAFNRAVKPTGRTAFNSRSPVARPLSTKRPPTARVSTAFKARTVRGMARAQFQQTSKNPTLHATNRNSISARASAVIGQAPQAVVRQTFNHSAKRGGLSLSFRHRAGYPDSVKGTIRERVLRKGEEVYRTHSGAISGRYAALKKPTSMKAARKSLALPEHNRATKLAKYVARGGERVRESIVAAANGQPGGGRQIYFLDGKQTFQPAGWLRGGLSDTFGRFNRTPMQYFLR